MRNSSDLPGGPTGPVFRLPNFGKPSRGRIVVSVAVGLVLLLVLSARAMSSFYVNVLWFNSVGRSDVYWAILQSKAELVAVFTAGCFVFLWVNLVLADRLAPLTLPNTPEDQTVIRIRELTAKSRGKLRIALAALIALMLGLPASSQWQEWTMFRNRQAFPDGDPLFKANVGFYVFRLPFAQFVVAWSFGALVLVLIITTAFHFINGSIRLQDRVQRVTSQAKVHLSVLLAIGTLLRAANYWLSKYDLTSSSRGVVRGALYTDVNAQLPALNLMILVSLAVTALLLWNIRQKGWRLPVLAIGLWVVVALAVGTVYPTIIQRFVVQPNVSTRELPFIQRNIVATKTAMGIADVARQETTFSSISAADVTANDASLRDVRQLDPTQMLDRFALDQGLTSFYTVNDLDVDRYSVDGRVQQVLVAARELNPAGIPNRTWVSRHLIYTHGCGLIAAPASLATEDGRPSYIDLKVTKPQIYFGDRLGEYAVVKSSQKEQACPGGNETSFIGDGGIKFNSFVRRFALAVNFGEFNLFGSSLITKDSQILLHRDVRSRVAKIAPFLHLDADPYAVVVNGQVKWVVDAFTTTNRYPYAETANVSQLTAGSGLNHSFNYVRNSIKAVVDAYSGEVTLYLMDTKDPIARMWSKAFPNIFAKKSAVPDELAAHFRYPEDLFRVQTNMFGRYQFDDATLFFNRDAAWSVAQAPANAPETGSASTSLGSTAPGGITPVDSINASDSNVERFTPYFSIFHEPNAKTDVGQFSMVRPFVPFSADDSRKELRSLMVVSSEPKTYGKITVYDIKTPLPAGPATVSAQFESEPAISQTITPLDQRGSRVTYGDLQLVPVGKGLVYIRPMFVQPDGADRQVFVRKILAGYGDRSVIGDSLTSVISQLFPGFNLDLGDRVGRPSSTPTTTVPGSPTTIAPPAGTTPAELLRQAEALFAQADAALAKSPPDFATYQTKLSQARGLVQQALAAVKG